MNKDLYNHGTLGVAFLTSAVRLGSVQAQRGLGSFANHRSKKKVCLFLFSYPPRTFFLFNTCVQLTNPPLLPYKRPVVKTTLLRKRGGEEIQTRLIRVLWKYGAALPVTCCKKEKKKKKGIEVRSPVHCGKRAARQEMSGGGGGAGAREL